VSLSDQLSAMIFELRSAPSPVARAKALARAWRFIRRLGPSERTLLAREAGFDGAEDLLESVATRKGGVAPAILLQLLGAVRDRGDEDLRLLMRALKDPKRREQVLLHGVDALSEALEPEEIEEFESEIPQEGEPIDEFLEESAPLPIPEPSEEWDEVDVEPDVEPEESEIAEPEIEAPAPPPDEPERVIVTPPPVPVPVPDGPEKPPAPASEAAVPPSSPGRLPARLEAETSLVTRLLVFRDALKSLGDSTLGEFRRLLETFPDGWPRRRALAALLEAGFPEDTAEALNLISNLEGSVDRAWCLGILLDRGPLSSLEADRARDLVAGSAMRRRIERAELG